MIKIAFSFDDGRMDNYYVAKEILKPRNIKASFNITSGYVMNEINDKDKPSEHIPMTFNQLNELYHDDLFEIAGHGYLHNNNHQNLIFGNNHLKKILNDKSDIVGIASPHSEFDLNSLEKFKEICKKNDIKYLRTSYFFKSNSFYYRALRKINRKLNIPQLFYYVYKNSNVKQNDTFLFHSVGIIKDTKLKEIKYLVTKAIEEDKNFILMFHSILEHNEKFYDDLFSWDRNDFIELCDFLVGLQKNKKIEICKVKDFIR